MKNVIVPVDFSVVSENAALYAANLAEYCGADLWLYHSFQLPVPLTENVYPLVSLAEMKNAAEEELDSLRKRLQPQLRRNINMYIKTEESGLQTGLEGLCRETNADLVVMGITGKDALTRFILGSNTLKAIELLSYPVLVVPKEAIFKPLKKVGMATDYRDVSAATPIGKIRKLIEDFGAELHVINVDWENRHFKPDTPFESFVLNELLIGLRPEYHQLESEDLTTALNEFAGIQKLDLVIVVPKRHSLIEKIFKKSHTQALIYHTWLPVLCVHE